jgi:hypothetical protein
MTIPKPPRAIKHNVPSSNPGTINAQFHRPEGVAIGALIIRDDVVMLDRSPMQAVEIEAK